MLKTKQRKNRLIICFMMVFGMLSYIVNTSFASATGNIFLTTNQSQVQKGEEIEVTLNIKNTKTAAFQIDLYFDETKLEYVSGPENVNVLHNHILYVWYDTQGGKGAKEGELDKFKFRAKEEGTVTFVVDGEFYNSAGQRIQTSFKELSVQIGKEETPLQTQTKEEQGTSTNNSNANLYALRINQEGVIPNFEKNIYEYYLTVPNEVNQIEVIGIPENPNAVVEISGNTNLKQGLNSIKVLVTSEDKSKTNTYTIETTRTANLELANTNLETLAVQDTLLYPPFDNTVTNYTTQVSKDTTNLNLLAIPENEKATVKIEGKDNLKQGDNQVNIIVTAANGFTKKEYTIQVYKRNEEEEKKYKQEQVENQEKLEEAYEIEQTSNQSEEEIKEHKETAKTNIMLILAIVIIIIIAISGFIWYQKRKKKINSQDKK